MRKIFYSAIAAAIMTANLASCGDSNEIVRENVVYNNVYIDTIPELQYAVSEFSQKLRIVNDELYNRFNAKNFEEFNATLDTFLAITILVDEVKQKLVDKIEENSQVIDGQKCYFVPLKHFTYDSENGNWVEVAGTFSDIQLSFYDGDNVLNEITITPDDPEVYILMLDNGMLDFLFPTYDDVVGVDIYTHLGYEMVVKRGGKTIMTVDMADTRAEGGDVYIVNNIGDYYVTYSQVADSTQSVSMTYKGTELIAFTSKHKDTKYTDVKLNLFDKIQFACDEIKDMGQVIKNYKQAVDANDFSKAEEYVKLINENMSTIQMYYDNDMDNEIAQGRIYAGRVYESTSDYTASDAYTVLPYLFFTVDPTTGVSMGDIVTVNDLKAFNKLLETFNTKVMRNLLIETTEYYK